MAFVASGELNGLYTINGMRARMGMEIVIEYISLALPRPIRWENEDAHLIFCLRVIELIMIRIPMFCVCTQRKVSLKRLLLIS